MKLESRLRILLHESVLDRYHEDLAEDIWIKTGPFYKLRPEIRQEIMNGMARFIPMKYVKKAAVIGSITSHLYNRNTDVDAHIISTFSPDQTEQIEILQDRAEKASSGKIADRPLQYYVHNFDDDFATADSAFDIMNNKWLKYVPLEQVNIRDYWKLFRSVVNKIDLDKSELYRDLVDYAQLTGALKHASEGDVDDIEKDIRLKLDEINTSVDKLVIQYKEVKDARADAYLKAFEQDDIDSIQQAATYSDANIIYKLLEKYSYKAFLKALKKFKEEHGEITSRKVGNVTKIIKKYG